MIDSTQLPTTKMRTRILLVAISLLAFASTGCLNAWHEEHFSDHVSYPSDDAATMREQLQETLAFLKSIGLKRLDQPKDDPAATEAIFIRDFGDHFHMTVIVRGMALVNRTGWTVVVQVESYNVGEEGAENAGHAMLKEIDNWEHRPRISLQIRAIPKDDSVPTTTPTSKP